MYKVLDVAVNGVRLDQLYNSPVMIRIAKVAEDFLNCQEANGRGAILKDREEVLQDVRKGHGSQLMDSHQNDID